MDFDDDDDFDRDEILDRIREQGEYIFNDGRMLIECPEREELTACGLYSMPDPDTGDQVMVCTGPVVTSNEELSEEDQDSVNSCQYHSDRLTEASSDNWM